jgi:DNA-binding transcriptional ArsR family regulator
MAEERDQSIHEASKLLFLCLYDLQKNVMQDWQSLNMTMAQLKVLITLSFKGPAAISKVAEALSISHPTASHLVDRLVQTGLVERVLPIAVVRWPASPNPANNWHNACGRVAWTSYTTVLGSLRNRI